MSRKRAANSGSAYRRMNQTGLADVLGTTTRTIAAWTVQGMPRNADGSYDSAQAVAWIEARAGAQKPAEPDPLTGLRARKLEQDIETNDLVLSAKKGEMVTMAFHDAVLGAQASEMRAFLTGSFPANAEHFVGRSVEDIRALLLELARQAVEVWINAPAKKLVPKTV